MRKLRRLIQRTGLNNILSNPLKSNNSSGIPKKSLRLETLEQRALLATWAPTSGTYSDAVINASIAAHGDTVNIADGETVVFNLNTADTDRIGTLNIESGGSLTINFNGTANLMLGNDTDNGDATIINNGTLIFGGGGTGEIDFSPTDTGNNLNITGPVNSTISAGDNVVNLTGDGANVSTLSLGGAAAQLAAYGNATITTLTLSDDCTITVANNKTLTTTARPAATKTLLLDGQGTITTVSLANAGTTLDVDESGSVTTLSIVDSATVDVANTKTLTTTARVSANETLSLASTGAITSIILNGSGSVLDVNASCSVNSLTINQNASVNIANTKTLTLTNTTLAEDKTLTLGEAGTLSKLSIDNTGTTLNVDESCTITTLDINESATLDVANTKTLTLTNPDLASEKILTLSSTGTISKIVLDNDDTTLDVNESCTVSALTLNESATVDVADTKTLTLTAAATPAQDKTLTLSGKGTVSAVTLSNTGTTLDINESCTVTTLTLSETGTIDVASGKTLTATANPAVNKTLTLSGAGTVSAVTISNTGNTLDVNESGTITTLTLSETGTIDIASGKTLTATANPAMNKTLTLSGKGTLSTVTISNTGNTLDINEDCTITTLTVSESGTIDLAAGKTLTATAAPADNKQLTLSGTGTLSAVTLAYDTDNTPLSADNATITALTITGAKGITMSGNLQVGTLTIDNSGGSLALAGNTLTLSNTAALTGNVTGNGTVIYDNTATHSGDKFTGAYDLTVSGAKTVTLGANTSAGTLTVNSASGALALNSKTLTLGGSAALTGSVTGSGIVQYTATANHDGSKFTGDYDLTIDSATDNQTLTLTSATDIDDLTIETGDTLDANGKAITLAGDWTNSGTFTHNNNTVTLNGASQTINDDNTFYKLIKEVETADTLTFEAGSTQTITNTLQLEGVVSNQLSLRSSSTGTQWKIDPQGTNTLSYLNLKDSNNISGSSINLHSTNSTDSGNNTNWYFNTAPTVTGSPSVTVLEDSTATFTVADFNFDDTDNDSLSKIRIVGLPTAGTLKINGGAAAVNDEITSTDITAGKLTYLPAANANGNYYAYFNFKVHDGTDFSATTKSMIIHVTAVNDEPSFVKGSDLEINEGSGAYTAAWATSISAGADDETASQTLTFTVSTNNDDLFTVLPAINSSGVLTFTPAPEAYGEVTVTVSLSDNGGTANGGDATGNTETFTITILSIDDAPAITIPSGTLLTLEDTAVTITGISLSDPDTSSGQLSVALSASHGTLNVSSLTGNLTSINAALASIVYTPDLDYNGSDTIIITAIDTGAGGGADQTSTAAIPVNISSYDDAPEIVIPANPDNTLHPQGNNLIDGAPVTSTDGELTFDITATDDQGDPVSLTFYIDIAGNGLDTGSDTQLTAIPDSITGKFVVDIAAAVTTGGQVNYGWYDVYIVPKDSTNNVGEAVKAEVLVPNRVSLPANDTLSYIDGEGNNVTIRTSAGATGYLLLSGNTDERADCYNLVVPGGANATVSIATDGDTLTIENLTVSDLTTLNAPELTVSDTITIAGTHCRTVKIESFRTLNVGNNSESVSIKAGDLTDANLIAGGNVNIKADTWTAGSITAGSIDNLSIRSGDSAIDIATTGDIRKLNFKENFSGDITSGANLSNFSVKGDYTGNMVIAGEADKVTVRGNFIGDLTASTDIGKLNVRGDLTGDITVTDLLANAKIGGDYTGDLSADSVGKFTTGTISGTIQANRIEQMTISDSMNGSIFAGVKDTVPGMPDSLDDFDTVSSIGKLSIGSRNSQLSSIQIAARDIDSLLLNTPAGSIVSGSAVCDTISKYKRSTGKQRVTYTSLDSVQTADSFSEFEVIIL